MRESYPEDPTRTSPKGERGHYPFDHGSREEGVFEVIYNEDVSFKNFVDQLTGNEKILDLGSGLGSGFVRYLRKLNKANDVVSLDLDMRNLETQNSDKTEGNALVRADAAVLPFQNASVDMIVQTLVLADNSANYGLRYEKISSEEERVLKPGGFFVLDDSGTPSSEAFELVYDETNKFDWRAKIYRRK